MKLTANELDKKVMEYVHRYDVNPVLSHMGLVGEGQILEVKNENPRGTNLYYQWLACLMRLIKPKQVVELGAAAGISTIMMATSMSKESKLYSVDNDPDLAWKWMDREYPQVVKILGDTRDINIWEEQFNGREIGSGHIEAWPMDLGETDVWFFDSLHVPEQIHKEMKLYSPFFKKGAILVFDDVHISPSFEEACNEIRDGKYCKLDWQDISTPCHWSGFSCAIVIGLKNMIGTKYE